MKNAKQYEEHFDHSRFPPNIINKLLDSLSYQQFLVYLQFFLTNYLLTPRKGKKYCNFVIVLHKKSSHKSQNHCRRYARIWFFFYPHFPLKKRIYDSGLIPDKTGQRNPVY